LESEAGAPAAAAKWFERYLRSARNPPLAEEAAGRLVEIYDQKGDTEAAARAAKGYLARHPDGPRAGLARKVLAAREVRP
jgi:outer membrane protein assembly factor BamD (BamD/ComL family)